MDSEPDEPPGRSSLRLKVLQTGILYKHHRLAVIDAYAEVQFGRDIAPQGSDTPRIRLKEMPVSKLHATAFWDKDRGEWAVVDMGSKHGTFLHSSLHPDANPVRLSPPRTASIPRSLHHLDQLIVGSTTFLCHIHADRMPCDECTSTGQDVIPLFALPKDRAAEKRPRADPQEIRDAKKALTSLRRTMLACLNTPHEHASFSGSYVDRSARRRAIAPSSQFDSPGVHTRRSNSPKPVESVEHSFAPVPGPLLEHNVGRRLLMRQGWQPGTRLGLANDDGLVEPIEVQPTAHRAGIGMPKDAIVPLSLNEWKQRRWEDCVNNYLNK